MHSAARQPKSSGRFGNSLVIVVQPQWPPHYLGGPAVGTKFLVVCTRRATRHVVSTRPPARADEVLLAGMQSTAAAAVSPPPLDIQSGSPHPWLAFKRQLRVRRWQALPQHARQPAIKALQKALPGPDRAANQAIRVFSTWFGQPRPLHVGVPSRAPRQ